MRFPDLTQITETSGICYLPLSILAELVSQHTHGNSQAGHNVIQTGTKHMQTPVLCPAAYPIEEKRNP
jgi:hypothetical protein